jgi:hypothetical protein
MDSDDTVGDIFVDDSGIEISLNALSGLPTGQTMRLGVAMRNQALIALVDSGSTHCFMAEHMARRLDLCHVSTAGMIVGVANGELPCVRVCLALSFTIHDEVFCMDFFVIALEGYEVVLGCNWLRTLGPIIWNFDILGMAFWRHDHRIKWIGEGAVSCPQALALLRQPAATAPIGVCGRLHRVDEPPPTAPVRPPHPPSVYATCRHHAVLLPATAQGRDREAV